MPAPRRRLEIIDQSSGHKIHAVFRGVATGLVACAVAIMFNGTALAQSGEEIAQAARDSVVAITASFSSGEQAKGFGFIVGERDGTLFIVTANHVVRRENLRDPEDQAATNVTVEFFSDQGRAYQADLRGRDNGDLDLAVLTVITPDGLTWPGGFGVEALVERNEEVWFVGRRGEWFVPANPGVVNRVDNLTHRITIEGIPISRGTSGAPLIANTGIAGMIIEDEADDISTVVTIHAIKEQLLEWQMPWGLEIGTAGIRARRFDAVGESVGGELSVGAGQVTGIAQLRNGNLAYSWFANDTIYTQVFELDGNAVAEATIVGNGDFRLGDLAATSDGGYMVIWANDDGSSFGVFGRRFSADGQPTSGTPFLINQYTNRSQQPENFGQGIATKDEDIVVAWQSHTQDGDSWGIVARQLALGPSRDLVFTDEFRVNTSTAGPQVEATVAILNDGSIVIVWNSQLPIDDSEQSIYAQRFGADGTPLGIEFRVNNDGDPATGNQSTPDVAALTDGGFVIAWDSAAQDGSGRGVYAKRYDAFGNEVGSEFRVNSTTIGDQQWSSIAGLKDGGFVITYVAENVDGDLLGIAGRRYNVAGTAVDEFVINAYRVGNQYNVIVAALEDGGFVATWFSAK